VDGLCTVSAVMAAVDPRAAAQDLRALIDDTLTRQEIK
jgi:thiamine-phosphate pyrophosphorylase/hydroxymethylpyrimidine kinase/phosphomethylpyrimidine kinase/thiamine-phosphate diphosphorylase